MILLPACFAALSPFAEVEEWRSRQGEGQVNTQGKSLHLAVATRKNN